MSVKLNDCGEKYFLCSSKNTSPLTLEAKVGIDDSLSSNQSLPAPKLGLDRAFNSVQNKNYEECFSLLNFDNLVYRWCGILDCALIRGG